MLLKSLYSSANWRSFPLLKSLANEKKINKSEFKYYLGGFSFLYYS